jgi:hypothetical protein
MIRHQQTFSPVQAISATRAKPVAVDELDRSYRFERFDILEPLIPSINAMMPAYRGVGE